MRINHSSHEEEGILQMEVLTNHESFIRNGIVLPLKKVNQEKQHNKRQYRDNWHDVGKAYHLCLLVDPKSKPSVSEVI